MEYRYHRPDTLDEALDIAAGSADAEFIAGGTDLMVGADRNGHRLSHLISLRGVAELAVIESGPPIRIGATTPLSLVADHPALRAHLPALMQSIAVFGSPQIRNMATIGGNLCNASPAADTAPPLLVYSAQVELCRPGSRRLVPLDEFFRAPGDTVLEAGEILAAVVVDPPRPDTRSCYLRRGRIAMDLAIAGVAGLVEMDGTTCIRASFAAGAVAPIPRRLIRTEAIVGSSDLEAATLAAAAVEAAAEVEPISDLRASAAYRRHLTGVLTKRCLRQLAPGEGSDRGAPR